MLSNFDVEENEKSALNEGNVDEIFKIIVNYFKKEDE